ncbi:hypothetical protein Droror1_Dr00018959 [Drosera rotundifolia]
MSSSSSAMTSQKTTFSHRCNLLSQYLKEKRSFQDQLSIKLQGEPTMNLFPQEAGFRCSDESTSRPTESNPTQMTIFYRGQVIVINDLPTKTAEEIMDLAAQHSSKNLPSTTNAMAAADDLYSCIVSETGKEDVCMINNDEMKDSDMPIARRGSLRRFFEKRKDRSGARGAPYRLSDHVSRNSTFKSPAQSSENLPWLGLGRQNSIELQLQL